MTRRWWAWTITVLFVLLFVPTLIDAAKSLPLTSGDGTVLIIPDHGATLLADDSLAVSLPERTPEPTPQPSMSKLTWAPQSSRDTVWTVTDIYTGDDPSLLPGIWTVNPGASVVRLQESGWYRLQIRARGETRVEVWPPFNINSSARYSTSFSTSFFKNNTDSMSTSTWLMYTASPGYRVTITATDIVPPSDPAPKLSVSAHQLTDEEFLLKLTDIAFTGAIAEAFLIRGLFVIVTIFFCTFAIHALVAKAINARVFWSLPVKQRQEFAGELYMLLRIARYGGYTGFSLWTVRDLLAFAAGV